MITRRVAALLATVAVAIAGIPALIALGVLPSPVPDAAWSGGDTQLVETARGIRDDYRPWFGPIFSPGDLGMERYLFGLQALLGTGALAGLLGWIAGQRGSWSPVVRRRAAAAISVAGPGLALALSFVRTDLGELQSFLSALQGIGLGSVAFVVGEVAGRRAAARAGKAVGG